jgi:tetratricopeptide (TPR) repeat protein
LGSSSNLDRAWSAYQQALALDEYSPTPWLKAETFHQRGNILAAQEQWVEAVQEYDQALALNEQHYWAHISLASALWQVGGREDAKRILHQAIELQPQREEAYWRLGNYYRIEQNFEQAADMYREMLKLNREDQRALNALTTLTKTDD